MHYIKKIPQIIILTLIILAGWAQIDACKTRDPVAYSQAIGFFACLIITLAAFILRPQLRKIAPAKPRNAKIFFILFGSALAVLVLFIFFYTQVFVKAPALSDKLFTCMTIYIAIIILFCVIQFRCRFSWLVVAALSGLYVFAIEAVMFHHLQGRAFTKPYLLSLPFIYGYYIIIAAAIFLPPTWAVENTITPKTTAKILKILQALIPLILILICWIIIYRVYILPNIPWIIHNYLKHCVLLIVPSMTSS